MMKRTKNIIFLTMLFILIIAMSKKEVQAQGIEYQYNEFTYTKDMNENIVGVWKDEEIVYKAVYDSDNWRISKTGAEECQFTYIDERLEREVRDGMEIDYLYTYDEDQDTYQLYGFSYENVVYIYNIDACHRIEGIKNKSGEEICHYIYGDNGVEIIEVQALINGIWTRNDSQDFIGNINRLRFRGEYYDVETKWYYNGVYMDAVSTDVIGLKRVYETIPEKNPFIDDIISVLAVDDLDLEVQNYAESLLADSEFNNAVPATSPWYKNISTIELLARVIYGENTLVTSDQNAIAWVILNRLESSSFPSDIKSILIADGQFSTVSSPNSDVTGAQNTQNTKWQSAVYLACLFHTTLNKSDWNSLGIPPVGMENQVYFTAWSNLNNFSCSNGVMYSGKYKVYNVYVVGYGNITTSSDISKVYNTYNKSIRNIYYDTNWER